MQEWLDKKEGKACPICRVAIDRRSLQRFTVEVTAKPAPGPLEKHTVPKSHRHIEYNTISENLFGDIKTMESHGSYGSKIQTLVQHLLYIELVEPGAKSIVFSAWADSLHSTPPHFRFYIHVSHSPQSSRTLCKRTASPACV